jgi:hypothetical protein
MGHANDKAAGGEHDVTRASGQGREQCEHGGDKYGRKEHNYSSEFECKRGTGDLNK